ncbi:hypothetical protein [Streptomyces yangpuensis]|uniref:hypothetical protein n=1 Tax=Streptomyces yangpuensis TaxID=1648182 RepID=UPI0036A4905E
MLLEQGRTALVQPYLPRVEEEGERALIFFAGTFSHAIRKQALLTGAELRTAPAALAAVPAPGEPLFARVDLVSGGAGEPVLMELELIEPDPFLGLAPHAADRLASVEAAAGREATAR